MDALHMLYNHAQKEGGLAMNGAWRLAPEECRRLEDKAGYAPPGGWRGLAALAAGCGVLKANREGFQPLGDWDGKTGAKELLEAFTRRLVPPTTAAGLFILLGVHPAWGVRLAHYAQTGETPDGSREELFPQETLEVVREAVFGVIEEIVEELKAREVHEVDQLAEVVAEACETAPKKGGAERGLSPFVEAGDTSEANWRVIDFTASDLIDAWLVPAQAVERIDEGRIRVITDALDDVRVK